MGRRIQSLESGVWSLESGVLINHCASRPDSAEEIGLAGLRLGSIWVPVHQK